jgi:acyl-homoserine lactone acylase PvdQ
MLKPLALSALLLSTCTALAAQQPAAPPAAAKDLARYRAEAARVTITRDDWGIAHIHGHTDADAVFGMIYAQCEDDFNRVETNYLVSLGRLSEAEGESALWQDLRQRLFLDPADLQHDYTQSPPWLRSLMDAWADGLNFYLVTHPDVHPSAITHFEPWMALSFTEGSIGGDIERVNLQQLRAFYDKPYNGVTTSQFTLEPPTQLARAHTTDNDLGGSNGFAIAPSNTVDHHALLLINPHTSFFFRSELQMSSDEGLNAYGASTWGQFFVYQGFNERAGWMHTSSNVDAVDEFTDDVLPLPISPATPTPTRGTKTPSSYSYGTSTRLFKYKPITLSYKTPNGLQQRTIMAMYDHRGPIVRRGEHNTVISIELMNLPMKALEQSWLRTKAHTYADYRKTMEIDANSSNNTIFADADGDIAYWHGNFIPKRDTRFDYTHPVDGSNPATDWGPLMSVDEIPHLLNPKSGWLENVNNWPWSGAGESSLKQSDFPAYVEQGSETARGIHAVRVLSGRKDFTLDNLLSTAAFDPYLPWFARTIPALLAAYDALPATDPQRTQLKSQIDLLRYWDFRWASDSKATSLAVYWGEAAGMPVAADARRTHTLWEDFVIAHVPPAQLLNALASASAKLTADFGTWQIPWGDINRFQRLDDDIVTHFSDAAPSYPIPFTASTWGSLASLATRPTSVTGTKKRYGVSGNSFVAVVEFGPRVRARAVTAGGESGHPASPHFNDEVSRYASGNFRDVYFYPDQLTRHTERSYHPGN